MDKKKRILIVIIILVLLLIGIGAVIILVRKNDNDEHNAPTTTAVIVEEPTTDTTVEEEPVTETTVEEEPVTETTEAEDTGATQATTESPAKPETAEAPSAPAQSATTEAPAPTQSETTEAPVPTAPTTEEPKHEHNWVWVKTKDASKVWVVDQAAYIEYKEHPEEYHWWTGYACHYDGCGMLFDTASEAKAHCDAQTDDYHFCAGWGSATRKIVDKPAWTEEIPHEEVGHWEETPEEGYYKCDCGATK